MTWELQVWLQITQTFNVNQDFYYKITLIALKQLINAKMVNKMEMYVLNANQISILKEENVILLFLTVKLNPKIHVLHVYAVLT